MDLWNLPTTEKDAVAFFQEKGVLLNNIANHWPLQIYFINFTRNC